MRIKSISIKVVCFVLVTNLSLLGHSQDISELYSKSTKAYELKDYASFEELNKEALKLHPSQPTLLYNLALAQFLNGKDHRAIDGLRTLLSWNAELKIKEDTELNHFLSDIQKHYLDSLKIKYNTKNEVSSTFLEWTKKSHLEDFEIIDEHIYLTDLHRGILTKYNFKHGYIVDNLYFKSSPFSVAASDDKKYLYVSTSMLPNFISYREEENKKSKIYKVDADLMKVVSEVSIPQFSIVGSMIFKDGTLYISNSADPEILLLNGDTLSILSTLKLEDAFNLQGITIDRDKGFIYVADYIKGILQIDISNLNSRNWLKVENQPYLLKGIDGLTYDHHTQSLLATQNNSTPNRVININLGEYDNIINVEILDNLVDHKGEPTNIKSTQSGIFYISNSQWPYYRKEFLPSYEDWNPQRIKVMNYEN